jgi:hypothetical protein
MEAIQGDDAAFKVWMGKVNAKVGQKYGLSVDDLPDCPFMDWFDDGMSPAAAANKAAKNAGAEF